MGGFQQGYSVMGISMHVTMPPRLLSVKQSLLHRSTGLLFLHLYKLERLSVKPFGRRQGLPKAAPR
jgi:hypothetical protein